MGGTKQKLDKVVIDMAKDNLHTPKGR